MKRLSKFLFLPALAAAALWAAAAAAQQECMERSEVVALLEERFRENVVGRGLTEDGRTMIEVFASDTGTWTLLVSLPDGESCIIAHGDAWQQIPSPLRGGTA